MADEFLKYRHTERGKKVKSHASNPESINKDNINSKKTLLKNS